MGWDGLGYCLDHSHGRWVFTGEWCTCFHHCLNRWAVYQLQVTYINPCTASLPCEVVAC